MSGESNADVYASFGVNSAVVTGGNPVEHEQNMVALNVETRDGDDLIEAHDEQPEDLYNIEDKFAEEQDPNRMQVRIGEEASEDANADEAVEESAGEEELSEDGETPEEFVPLGDAPADLTEVTQQITEHEQGFQEMVADAINRGMSEEYLATIEAEYAGDGISDASYEKLKAIGYSKAFVDSYMRGQEALVNQYVAQAKAYAGGEERFNALHAHLKSTNPEAASALETAFGNRDLGTMKAIINLAGSSFTKKFGKPAERSVTKRAIPVKPQVTKAEGFQTRDEMIKAMSDSRYRSDAAYRREVEQKVINSAF